MKNSKIKLKKGDTVVVRLGKDSGKKGKIEKVFSKEGKVLVPGVNEYKKHVKRQGERPGEILTLSRPLLVGKVALVCPKCKKTTKVGYKITGDVKVRVCKKCEAEI